MTVELFMNGYRYDVTSYIDYFKTTITQSIDLTLPQGMIGFKPMAKYQLGELLDLSRKLIRLSRIRITEEKEVYDFLISEPKVDDLFNGQYLHEVKLISMAVLLQKRPIPNMTITQSRGTLGLYTRSALELTTFEEITEPFTSDTIKNGYSNDGLKVQNTPVNIPYTLKTQSPNLSIINSQTMVEANREYVVSISMLIYNIQRYVKNITIEGTEDTTVTVELLIDGDTYSTETIDVKGGTTGVDRELGLFLVPVIVPNVVKVDRTFYITPTLANQTITVRLKTNGSYVGTSTIQDTVWVTQSSISLATRDVSIAETIYNDDVIDKVLSSVRINQAPKFILGANTRAKLSQLPSSNHTWEDFYIYDALQKIAGENEAIVDMTQIGDYTLWVEATELEYTNSPSKLDIVSSRELFMNILNWKYNNYPLGYVAKRFTEEDYEFIASSYDEYTAGSYYAWVESVQTAPFTYDVDNISLLPIPTSAGIKARVNTKTWILTTEHLADSGYIKALFSQLPTFNVSGVKGIVTGYDLITTTQADYDSGFQLQWTVQGVLTSPYDYDVNLYSELPATPPSANLKARVRTLAYEVTGYDLADIGFIKSNINDFPTGNANIGKKAVLIGYEPVITTLSEYNAALVKADITTDSSWTTTNADDMLARFQYDFDIYFMDLPEFAYQGAIKFSNGLTTTYWKFDIVTGNANVYYQYNVTNTDYYLSQNVAIKPRVEQVHDIGFTIDDVWYTFQSSPYFDTLSTVASQGFVLRVSDSVTFYYYKLNLVNAQSNTYYISNVDSTTYLSTLIISGTRLDVTTQENPVSIDVMRALKEQHPTVYADLETAYNDGLIVRADDGLGLSYWKLSEILQMYAKTVSGDLELPVIEFRFLEELEKLPPQEAPNINSKTSIAFQDDYVNAIQLNVKNILRSDDYIKYYPYRNGFATLRTTEDGVQQVTTANIGAELDLPIGKITKFIIKGIPVTTTEQSFASTVEWDVTYRVIDEEYYQTLENASAYTFDGRQTLNKNNTIFYTKGQNKIKGMSFTGTFEPQLIGEPNVIRAIYEMVYAHVTSEVGEQVTSIDAGTVTADNNIQIYVEYIPYSKTDAIVFKDDQTGFQHESIRYFNENTRLNDPKALGDYAQSIVNRMGNTNTSVTGWALSISDIPKIGSHNANDEVVVSRTLNIRAGYIDYILNYVKDYTTVSDYIGITSDIEVEEISSKDLVERNDKYVEQIIFTDLLEVSNGVLNPIYFLNGLRNVNTVKSPTYAYIEFEHKNTNVVRIETLVDTNFIGKNITYSISMKDNYSAGVRKYLKDGKWWSEDVPYTDSFGRVENMILKIYQNSNDSALGNNYPLTTSDRGDTKIIELAYNVNKDNREILSNTVEVSFLSNSDDVIVYSGIARHNPMAIDHDYNVKIATLDYIPSKSAKSVDLSRITHGSYTLTYGTNYIDISASVSNKGYIFYEENTLDILLVVKSESLSKRFYYKTIG